MQRTVVEKGPAVAAPAAVPPGHISLPPRFHFNPVDPLHVPGGVPVGAPDLGPLAAFAGTFQGGGFNTIFRPHHGGGDNVLELNLTQESLAFSPSLGAVPNRGFGQGDIFLNGLPYLQTISDVTTGVPVGIHAEPGLWIAVPPTVDPPEPEQTVARMASIPHGTTILAEGTALTTAGPPTIPTVDITPFLLGSNPPSFIHFPSQDFAAQGTDRIPQDLTNTGITAEMLADPNSVLRDHIAGQHILSTTTITVSTSPAQPLLGGGTDNIGFLVDNADAVSMTATFWIETVEHTILVPPGPPRPLELHAEGHTPTRPSPTFSVHPPVPLRVPLPITFRTTQIQYSQTVQLIFNNLSWPHVSVATLVPAGPVHVGNPGWPA